jgi:glycosyltransferase involved in cell wall biosynthesis
MKSAACLVLPSIFEGFGCVLIEAMACQTPVIASNIDGPSEIIEDNINGFLFEKNNEKELAKKIVSVYEDRSKVDAVVSKANETVKKYVNLEEKYEKYFNLVLNEEKTYEA